MVVPYTERQKTGKVWGGFSWGSGWVVCFWDVYGKVKGTFFFNLEKNPKIPGDLCGTLKLIPQSIKAISGTWHKKSYPIAWPHKDLDFSRESNSSMGRLTHSADSLESVNGGRWMELHSRHGEPWVLALALSLISWVTLHHCPPLSGT